MRTKRPAASRVVFVATTGHGSMDRYSRQLAPHLGVEILETGMYQRTGELFGIPLVSTRSLRGLAADLAFVRRLRRLDAVVHFPNHHMARYGSFLSAPHVVTVHDVIRHLDARGGECLIHVPNARDRIFLRLDAAGIRAAAAVIAVSEATKRDLVTHLGAPPERVFVVYEGVDHRLFRPVERRLLDARYVLFVGSEHPRKNLVTLLRAFASLTRERAFRDLKLVKLGAAGGPEGPFRDDTLRAVRELGLERDVVFTGPVDDEDLPVYYSGAECLVLPSLYEGFGLPPLEAMACGCPAIVSSAGSLPEIAGDAALAVDPRDADALAAAIRAVLTDDTLRADLRRRGRARAASFTWERAGAETMRVYDAVLAARRDGRRARPRPAASLRVRGARTRLAGDERLHRP